MKHRKPRKPQKSLSKTINQAPAKTKTARRGKLLKPVAAQKF